MSKNRFWNDMHNREKKESYKNNPDKLAVNVEVKSEELIAILEVLDEGGEQVLTKKQRRAFQLVVREGYTERDAALKMRCSQATLQEHIKLAVKKLRSLCQAKLGS